MANKQVAEQQYYFVEDIMDILHISKSTAYKIMRELNKELKEKGFYTQSGRVVKRYFDERNYIV